MTLIMTTLMNVNRKEQAIFEHANQILSHVTSDFSLLPQRLILACFKALD